MEADLALYVIAGTQLVMLGMAIAFVLFWPMGGGKS